jgi:hypothetical protein
MGDTPVPSPKVDVFAPRVLPTAPASGSSEQSSDAGHSQFLDLDEDEADDEDDD